MIGPPGFPPPAPRSLSLVAVVAIAVLLAACDGDGDPAAGEKQATDGEGSRRWATPGRTFRRECIAGTDRRPLETKFPENDLRAGPLTLMGVRSLGHRVFGEYLREERGSGGRWRPFKFGAEIMPPVEMTLSVAQEDRSSLLLIWDPKNFRRDENYRSSDGDSTVIFGACDDASPGDAVRFPGGFLARRPGCYRIAAASELDPEPVVRPINMGMGRGGCGGVD